MIRENECDYYTNTFRASLQGNNKWRMREKEDWKFYTALENGQWNSSAIQRMELQKRPIITWNFILKHVDTEAGMMQQNPNEFGFESEYGQNPKDARLLNELRLRDKDLGKWEGEKYLFVRDGLVNTGIMEMIIDDSQDQLGALNFVRQIPWTFCFDKNWQSTNINHNRQIFRMNYMDPEEIIHKFGIDEGKIEEIKTALEISKRAREHDSGETINKIYNNDALYFDKKDNKYLVIECMELVYERKRKLYNPVTLDTLEDIPPEARATYIQLLAMQGIPVIEMVDKKPTVMVKTYAPGLSRDLKLANGPHPIQVGRYPLVVWSAYNVNGERFGRVQLYKDPQSIYNKKIATFMFWQMTAGAGNKLVGPDAFEGGYDGEEFQRFIKEQHLPNGVFKTQNADAIKNLERGEIPSDLLKTRDDSLEFMNYIGANLSLQGKTEGANEPAALYDMKQSTAVVGLEGLNQGLVRAEHEMGEMYAVAAPQVYKDVPRVFTSKVSGELVEINTSPETDLSKMGRMSVRITQSPVGTTLRREELNTLSKLRQYAKSPFEDSMLAKYMVSIYPNLDDSTRAGMMDDMRVLHDNNRLKLELENFGLNTQKKQMVMQASQPLNGNAQQQNPGPPSPQPASGPAPESQSGVEAPGQAPVGVPMPS